MVEKVPLNLLVVDDHAAFRRTVRQMLEEPGVAITEAASGEEAVHLFAVSHPDWVIMDQRMPGMGGIKATQAIRQVNPQAQVIVISQFTDVEYGEQARRAGAVTFLSKEDLPRLAEIVHGQPPQT